MSAMLVSILICLSTSVSAFLHFYVALALIASKKVMFWFGLVLGFKNGVSHYMLYFKWFYTGLPTKDET